MSIQNRRPLIEDSPANDDFWNPDALKVVNTRSLQMRQTFEKVKSDDAVWHDTPNIQFKDFQIIKELGRGAFGVVYLCKYKPTGREYAMKCLKKRTLIKKNQLRYAVTERNVL